MPARVLLQDLTGVPLVVDLAAIRDAIAELGGEAQRADPLVAADLVIDHSVIADYFGSRDAFEKNAKLEVQRNKERYALLRWAQNAFHGFRVVPPDTGIVHQVNLEYLAPVVFRSTDNEAYPDTLIGADSHTTMINGLGVLGWGVGGIEAEAAMLGQPLSMLVPQVVGVRLTGALGEGATATDLVLTVTELLRKKGVVGKFVEFYGPGLSNLPLASRATIANMSPEYGATCGFFPVDDETLAYMRLTGRSEEQVALVEAYCKEQGLFRTDDSPDPEYSDVLELELSTVEPSLAGPARPQDRVPLAQVPESFERALADMARGREPKLNHERVATWTGEGGTSGRTARIALTRDQRARQGAARAIERAHGRRGRHRRDHELHEHIEPGGDGGRGTARQEGHRARAGAEALGEVEPRARLARRHRVPRRERPDALPRARGLLSRRLRLHDLHRQLRPAPGADRERNR